MYLRKLIREKILCNDFIITNPDGEKVKTGDFREEFNTLRSYLVNNIPEDRSVAIKLPKDHRYFMVILACMETGVPYIPLKEDFPAHRIEQIKDDSNFYLIIDENKINKILTDSKTSFESRDTKGENPLYIIFTSGSTGRPKGVVISRAAAENYFRWIISLFPNMGVRDNLLQITDFSFDISLNDIALFLGRGPSLFFSSFDGNPFELASNIREYRITAVSTVPNNFNMYLDDRIMEKTTPKTLKYCLIGGARFSFGLYKKCEKHLFKDCHVYNLYGPTECTIYTHIKKIMFNKSDLSKKNISIGRPIINMSSLIIDESNEEWPQK